MKQAEDDEEDLLLFNKKLSMGTTKVLKPKLSKMKKTSEGKYDLWRLGGEARSVFCVLSRSLEKSCYLLGIWRVGDPGGKVLRFILVM